MNSVEHMDEGPVRSEIKAILERAITDDDFRRQLLDDPDSVLDEYELSDVQTMLLRSLDESDLEKLTPENLDEYFAVDSAVYTPESVVELEKSYELADREIQASDQGHEPEAVR